MASEWSSEQGVIWAVSDTQSLNNVFWTLYIKLGPTAQWCTWTSVRWGILPLPYPIWFTKPKFLFSSPPSQLSCSLKVLYILSHKSCSLNLDTGNNSLNHFTIIWQWWNDGNHSVETKIVGKTESSACSLNLQGELQTPQTYLPLVNPHSDEQFLLKLDLDRIPSACRGGTGVGKLHLSSSISAYFYIIFYLWNVTQRYQEVNMAQGDWPVLAGEFVRKENLWWKINLSSEHIMFTFKKWELLLNCLQGASL